MAGVNKLYGFGNIASSAINAGLGLYSLHQQKKENEKTREYNLKLAQMQNQWNVEQWQRENDYNMPANQVARLKAAGLNPDLLYGGGVSNTAATSPQMTAGAAGSPMDWSSLANINPVNSYLDAQLKQAQLDNLREDATSKKTSNRYLDAEKQLGIKLSKQAFERNQNEVEILLQTIDQNKVKYQSMSEDLRLKQIEAAFRADEFQKTLDILANELKLKQNEVANMVKAKALAIQGATLDNQLKEADLKWNDPSILEKLGGDGAASLLKILMMIFK